jgi:hypothetical protein
MMAANLPNEREKGNYPLGSQGRTPESIRWLRACTVGRTLKERLDEPSVRLKSQYSSRLYQWAKQYVAVGYKRVSLATLRKILGLERH